MSDNIISDELKLKAAQKPNIDILFVSDGDSRLYPIRGESTIKSFVRFYDRITDTSYYTTQSKKLVTITDAELAGINVLWLDNLMDFNAARNLSTVIERIITSIVPEWRETLKELNDTDKDAATAYIAELDLKRKSKLRIIYALDEFVWDAPIGRSREVNRVQIIESMMGLADSIVVPNADLRDFITHFGVVREGSDIHVIPSALSVDFVQLYRNFNRVGVSSVLSEKPRILIKGIEIPENVQEFIMDNYKKMNITICSVGEVNQHVMGLIQGKKVNHIMHWAHPHVTRNNIIDTYAIERDMGFDVTIHTKPSVLNERYYELTCGDDDILFSIAAGSIPVCGTEHIGYSEDHLSYISGYVFGPDAPAKYLRGVIDSVVKVPVKFNEVYNKCHAALEHRVAAAPEIMNLYYQVMIGKELSDARKALASEVKELLNEKQEQTVNEGSENV